MSKHEHRRLVAFPCPFCGQPVDAGYNESGVGQVLHGMPMCREFETMTADRFLEACRKRRES